MNSRLRYWREAATLLLAAGRLRGQPRSPRSPSDYELLLLQRSSRSGFMPGAHVFPGGLVEAADFSEDWLRLLPAEPRCGLGPVRPPPLGSTRSPLFTTDRQQLGSPVPGEVAFRICAIRETFEEAGILLLVPGPGPAAGGGPAAPLPAERLPPPAELAEWRRRVREEPMCFLQLCRQLGCVPNIWALHEWSNWLTPAGRAGGRRYDTAFYLCCLQQRPPRTSQDNREVTAFLVRAPAAAGRSAGNTHGGASSPLPPCASPLRPGASAGSSPVEPRCRSPSPSSAPSDASEGRRLSWRQPLSACSRSLPLPAFTHGAVEALEGRGSITSDGFHLALLCISKADDK